MRIVDITPISLKDLLAVKKICKEAELVIHTRQNELVIDDDEAFYDLLEQNSELKELLSNMEESLYD